MNSIYLSSCKRVRAVRFNGDEFKVSKRKNDEGVGWIRFFNVGVLGSWMFDPLLTPLTCHELMAIADILVSMKVDHDTERYPEDEEN